jgi:hypothetical protein
LEKFVVEADVEAALFSFSTLPAWASWALVNKTEIFPSLNRLHLLDRAAAAKLP